MNTAERSVRPAGNTFNIGLAFVFVLGISFTTYMLTDSWGGASWVLGTTVSVVVSALALVRERHRMPAALAGLAVTGIAVAVSLAVGEDLPQEPAPITSLALAVLVGSAVRKLPTAPAAAIAAGGVVLAGAVWVNGWTIVTGLSSLTMAVALALGATLRVQDRQGGGNGQSSR
ncbi:metal transporter [Streptomyces yaizuensis]|uniref:Metal transporter n=1 Tax=Streptomyces yaizuensis TaxID=2989713 RepID=A0ABQ5NWU7_9ACTN|nr:metal transporter [Streptomyces sp. YSPA8]GLF94847.1 metal transporter [Streptomyces sp. YSPA8]